MAFQQFTFPQVLTDLGLTLRDADLFGSIAEDAVSAELGAAIKEGADLATAISTEKARSEFVIAPVLMELRRRHPGAFRIFSGVELVADSSRGLNGFCDFLLTKSPSQHVATAPILSIVEAKNDNPRYGFGQCIATMVAAGILHEVEGDIRNPIYGVATSGSLWRFLTLADSVVTLDSREYLISDLGKLLAILGSIVTSFPK